MGEKDFPGSERCRAMRPQALLFGHALLGRSGSTLEWRGRDARRRRGLDVPARLPGCLSSTHSSRVHWIPGVKLCRGTPSTFGLIDKLPCHSDTSSTHHKE